jgi:hypothetical protein
MSVHQLDHRTMTQKEKDKFDPTKWKNKGLPNMAVFIGPHEIRAEFISRFGIEWTASYIDPCLWSSPGKLIAAHDFARSKVLEKAKHDLTRLGITVSVAA